MHGWIPILFMDTEPTSVQMTEVGVSVDIGSIGISVGVVRDLGALSVDAHTGGTSVSSSVLLNLSGVSAETFPGNILAEKGIAANSPQLSIAASGDISVSYTMVTELPQLSCSIETSSLAFFPSITAQSSDKIYTNGNGSGQVVYGIEKRKLNKTGSGSLVPRPLQLAKTFPNVASAHGLFELNTWSTIEANSFLYRSPSGLLEITNDVSVSAAMLVPDGTGSAIPMLQPQEISLDRFVVFTEDRF